MLDDGHQNPSLSKALSLVVVDGETRDGEWPFGDGAVFPAGPDARAAARPAWPAPTRWCCCCPPTSPRRTRSCWRCSAATPVLVARLEPAAPPPPGPQLGFAGVAKPWKVERALRAAGCELADFVALPDHAALRRAPAARARRPRRRSRRRAGHHREGLGAPAAGVARARRRLAGARAVRGRGGARRAAAGRQRCAEASGRARSRT